MNITEKQERNETFNNFKNYIKENTGAVLSEKTEEIIKNSEINIVQLQSLTPLMCSNAQEKWYMIADKICREKSNPEFWLNIIIEAFCKNKNVHNVEAALETEKEVDGFLNTIRNMPENDSEEATASLAESETEKVTASPAESETEKVTASPAESETEKVTASLAESETEKVTASLAESETEKVTASLAESKTEKNNDFQAAAVNTVMNYIDEQSSKKIPDYANASDALISYAVEVRDTLKQYSEKIISLESAVNNQKTLITQQLHHINALREENEFQKEQIEFYKQQVLAQNRKEKQTNSLLMQLKKLQDLEEI